MYPDVYSRRIQHVGDFGLAIPLPKRGNGNRFLDGFHKADETAPTEETYVCIHL
jgi:ribonuclease P protein 3